MTSSPPTPQHEVGLQMRLPAKAENVAVVRHALAGLAEQVGMDDTGVADLKTAVTEACMNVVVHAYPDGDGALTIDAEPDTEFLTVTVKDEGAGISPRADSERQSLKLGLSMIAALCSSFSISGGLGRGTEVMMRIPLHSDRDPRGTGESGAGLTSETGGTTISVGRPELLAPVLARLVGAVAARRDLSIDRVSDAVLVTDAIAGSAPGRFEDGHVRMKLDEGRRGLELRLGPMEPGGAGKIRDELRLPDIGGSLETLVDGLAVETADDGEYLVVCFAQTREA